MADCEHNCGSCDKSCAERDFRASLRAGSSVKKVIGIVSGKGGVGKSLVTSLLASKVNKDGFRTAILDADITGPSIPKTFGVTQKAMGNDSGIFPAETDTGIEIMSVNMLLENDTDPVLWRGPVIAGTVKQFWTDVIWNDVDVMFIDMPPGTGDVPLTVFQSIPVDGIIIVTSPQDLVSLIVSKAVNMARLMNIPIIGIVENMSYVECPDCGKKIEIFGKSHTEETAKQFGIPVLARIPVNPELASQCDKGVIELFEGDWMGAVADAVEAQPTRER